MPQVGRKASVCAVALAVSVVNPVIAEEAKPAVSGINGKIDVTAGAVDSYNTTLYSGSLSAPVGDRFGVQLDFTGGEFSADRVLGIGGHFFWRDPGVGLVGVVASRSGFADVWGSRYGAEAEAYLGPITLAAMGGWQNGERKVFQHTPWYGADARWYPLDDLMLEVGGSHYAKVNALHAGLEWRPGFLDAVPGATLFADTAVGNKGYDHTLAGVRIYFGGGDKSLIRRHREDDPLGMLVGGVSASGSTAPFGGTTSTNSTGTSSSGMGGGGGGSCFIAGTGVLMADGTVKAIEDVLIGEKLAGADGAVNDVLAYDHPLLGGRKLHSLNGGSFFVTAEHPFMTTDGWKSIDPAATAEENIDLMVGRLEPGDTLLAHKGTVALRSIESAGADPAIQVFNFRLSGNNTYFVRPAGAEQFLLVHNK